MKRFLLCTTLLLIALTVSVAVPTAGAVDKTPIVVGVPTMITGIGAAQGKDIMEGAQMAEEDINASGGVLGRPIKIVYADVGNGTAEEVTSAANMLQRAGAVAYLPGATMGPAAIHVFGALEPPFLHANTWREAVEAYVANKKEYANIFQLDTDEYAYGPAAFDTIARVLPWKAPNTKIALLGSDVSYCMIVRETARDAAKKAGWTVVLDDVHPFGTTDFSAQLAKIRAEKPAIIVVAETTVDCAVAFMNQFWQNPTNSQIYINFVPSIPEFGKLLGSKANGVLWQTCLSWVPTDKTLAWVDRYRKNYGRDPGGYVAFEYDSFMIWKTAVEAVGSEKDYQGIIKYLENLSRHPYDGLCGRYGQNPERHEGLGGAEWIPMHFYQIQNGENKLLYLSGKPWKDNKYQTPPWFK